MFNSVQYIVHNFETKERNDCTIQRRNFIFLIVGSLCYSIGGSRDTRGSINTSLLASGEETCLEIDTDYWILFLSLGGGT